MRYPIESKDKNINVVLVILTPTAKNLYKTLTHSNMFKIFIYLLLKILLATEYNERTGRNRDNFSRYIYFFLSSTVQYCLVSVSTRHPS